MDKRDAIALARKKSDTLVLIITVFLALSFLGILAMANPEILLIVLFSLMLSLFYVSVTQTSLLANAMRIQNGKNAELRQLADEITKSLNAPPVDIYVSQDPYLNAFAIGYTRPFSIVLHSAVVENLNREETKAILLHELGHIIYRHTIITSYIYPLTNVPIVGQFITWLFGFWSRRAEMACDRLAASYLGDSEPVMKALINIHVGAKSGQHMGVEGVVYQDVKGKSMMRQIAQSLQTHPFLVTRIAEVARFSNNKNIKLPQSLIEYLKLR